MRCLSRIIKSAKVSLGKQMELDSDSIVKEENIISNSSGFSRGTLDSDSKQPIAKTQEQIEAMYIEEARKKSELFFDKEMRRAYSEGMEKANSDAHGMLEDARAEAEKIISESMQIKNNIANDYKKAMESMEKEIVELALEVAQKVVAKEIEKSDYILKIVAEAIDNSASKKDTVLKVSEEDYEFIIKNKEKILLNVEGFGEVEIIKESSLHKGSCIVETKFGIIDGSLKTRMSQIEKEVQRVLNR